MLICADVAAWQKQPERYWQNVVPQTREVITQSLHQFYDGRPQMQRDEALRSVGLVAQTLMLAAKSIGYDSSPMVGFDMEQVAQLINLPEDHLIGMMVAIGKGIAEPWPRGGQLDYHEVVVENRFS